MKVQNLNRGQFFKFGKQRNWRMFQNCQILDGESTPEKYKGKLLVMYGNCKEMFCDPEQECELKSNSYLSDEEPVIGFAKGYSTSVWKIPVNINGAESVISHFKKHEEFTAFLYTIQNSNKEFQLLDTRNIDGFPTLVRDTLIHDGIHILAKHIAESPNSYMEFVTELEVEKA